MIPASKLLSNPDLLLKYGRTAPNLNLNLSPGWWIAPKVAVVTSGAGLGRTELTSFDKALLKAGIGDLNLLRVTSVLPPGARVVQANGGGFELPMEAGSLAPVVYGTIVSNEPGLISAAVAVGIPVDTNTNGMIFESALRGPEVEAASAVRHMVREAFEMRHRELREMVVASSEIEVSTGYGAAVAAVLLLP